MTFSQISPMPRLVHALMGGCALAVIAGAALADPPGRVGRISAVVGDVSLLPPGQSDWTFADRNFPVTSGESFWTGDDGQVELQVGVMEVRADDDTDLDVLSLDYGQTRLGLSQGSVDLRLWRLPRGGVSIATPAGDVLINAPGVYRLDVGQAGDDGAYPPVEVTVFEGDAGAPTPEGFADVGPGAAAVIYAGYDPEFEDAQDAAIDDWARQRESEERWQAQADFAPSMTGYEDLAGQGEFVSTPDYGTVWFPTAVPADWAPYRYGRWAYVAPWGYTWIDDAAWGFAPFHYGRWVVIDGRWGWVPGQPADEPVYAPALVAFFGGAGASIGWVPLGPDEVYRPSYDVSDAYLRRVNVTSVSPSLVVNLSINAAPDVSQYRNAHAAVVVAPDALARGVRVQTAASPVGPAALAQAAPAPARALPPPERGAIAGPRPGEAGRTLPPAPPRRLQDVRASVAAQAPGSTRPPVIAGATIAPPRPRASGAPTFIAPSQMKNPALQARRPVLPPAAGPASVAGPPPASPNGQRMMDRRASQPQTAPRPSPPGVTPEGGPPAYARPPRQENAYPSSPPANRSGEPAYARPPRQENGYPSSPPAPRSGEPAYRPSGPSPNPSPAMRPSEPRPAPAQPAERKTPPKDAKPPKPPDDRPPQ